MKRFPRLLVLVLAAQVTLARSWFNKAVYNKWHETELERWLSDHRIPYPTPADRKDLENLMKENWQSKVVTPYQDWDPSQLAKFLSQKGFETKDALEESKGDLLAQVKQYWYETEDEAEESWSSVKEWIFDSWTDSQLKAFADHHNIPIPQPPQSDTLLQKIRLHYASIANKAGETVNYPGDWLYHAWTESDLKKWLQERGYPVPQPTTRDKLIASVRRNSHLASLKLADAQASASSSAADTAQTLSDYILDAWSDSQIKAWLDRNNIPVPQGSEKNELIAIARKHRAAFMGNTAFSAVKGAAGHCSSSAASAFGAATSSAGNEYIKATDSAQMKAQDSWNSAIETWSESRLKGYLDSRGVPVPQFTKRDELVSAVRLHMHKAATGYSAWSCDTWTFDSLRKYLLASGNEAAVKAAEKVGTSRNELFRAAQNLYSSASSTGGVAYTSAASYLAMQTNAIADAAFDTWSESELKAYLDSYGIKVPQGSTKNEIIATARRQANWFKYGATTPSGIFWAKLQESIQWVLEKIRIGTLLGGKQSGHEAENAAHRAKEGVTSATDWAGEAAQRAGDRIKEL